MNFSQVVTQSGAIDEDFIAPVTPVGEVLVNGAIATGSVIAAMQNKNARYPLPSGQSLEMVGRVRRAAIVYRLVDENDYLENSFERYSNTTVAGLTALNGQGHANESQASFMSRIQVIGIAQQETEQNGSKLFNIHIGGVYTMINNSDRDIAAGDWLMAYAPRPDEVKQGGRGKEHDANGYVELWMVPYDPSIHQATSAHIYACLSEHNIERDARTNTMDTGAYLQEYVSMCDHLLDSFMDLGLIFVEFMVKNNLVTVNGAATDAQRHTIYANLLTQLGNTQFYTQHGTQPALRQQYLEALFLDRLVQKGDIYKRANYFPGNDKQQRTLRECQLEAVSLGLTEQANFVHSITKHVFAKAITSAAPKKNLQVQLCSMIGCK